MKREKKRSRTNKRFFLVNELHQQPGIRFTYESKVKEKEKKERERGGRETTLKFRYPVKDRRKEREEREKKY